MRACSSNGKFFFFRVNLVGVGSLPNAERQTSDVRNKDISSSRFLDITSQKCAVEINQEIGV